MSLLSQGIIDKIKEYLAEDIGFGDITTKALVKESQRAKARLYFKEQGIASGLEEASTIFRMLGCNVNQHKKDGELANIDETLLSIEGSAHALLMGERVALNLVGRMAGIATQTVKIIEIVSKHKLNTRIAATRKTMPGLREFDKRAVAHGGGDTHRFGLDDCVLIKDNHLELVSSISEAIRLARKNVSFTKMIEIEVRSFDAAVEAARSGADIIMFDNLSPEEIKSNLDKLDNLGLRNNIIFEASGGINAENVEEYVKTGVDVISLGSLTHSVRSLDVKLKIEIL
jgi:nicotinate-nucleotide pyrophosphorylase (carboxylating)